MSSRSNSEWILQLSREGDARAPGLIYACFGADINRLVRRIMGVDGEHDDLVHQILIKLVLGVGRVRDHRALRGWVTMVAINTISSELKRRNTRRTFLRLDNDAIASTPALAPDYEAREMLKAARELFDRMPAQERLAFILRLVEKRPLVEVAALCECSLATVKRRLTKASRRFSKLAFRESVLSERFMCSPLAERVALRNPCD